MQGVFTFLALLAGIFVIVGFAAGMTALVSGRSERKDSEHKNALRYKKALLEIEDVVSTNASLSGMPTVTEDMILAKVRKAVRQLD